MTPSETARACLQAYIDKDRDAIEELIATDFSFTSPLDNRLGRATYFARCWPNSAAMEGVTFIHVVEHGDTVFLTYEAEAAGKRFRNTEILTVRNGRITEVEVYFGWNIPHKAKPGGFVDQA